MTEITTLDQQTVSKIAAGEVVERPASVVKELVENSLDADATRIDVTVEAGGREQIVVADDGTGMDERAAKKAIQQHTTSKIRTIDDLESGISTLGFRGEALYTIGAVSRMTITTRPHAGEDVGTELYVVGGDLEDVAPAGRAPGTTVEVADLFFNTPARRKYLKRDATEFAHVNRVVTRYALANPDVALSLTHDGTEVFATSGLGDLQEAILSVYGRNVAESMIEVASDPDGPLQQVSGYVSDPETTRSGSEYVSTFVNGRYVRAGLLREAVVAAYGNQLAPDRFPFAVLFLEVPPETVDVNVHPRKMEVRFDDEGGVKTAVKSAVKEALLDHGLVRTSAPRGRSAPEETTIEPATREQEETDPAGDREGAVAAETATDVSDASGQQAASSEDGSDSGEARDSDGSASTKDSDRSRATIDEHTGQPETSGPEPEPHRKFQHQGTQTGLTEATPDLEFDTLPPLRVLGQAHDTYIVAESADGILLIDQHAADERVNYERLVADLAERTESQRLVDPVEVEVTPQEASLFDAVEPDIAEMGFEAHLDGQRVVVEAVPAVFAETLSPSLLRDVLGSFLEAEESRDLVASAADALLADMACYPAITGNTSLTEGAVIDLLRELDACENPYACPHGRPVIIELSETELSDRFERDYPGHATRRPEE